MGHEARIGRLLAGLVVLVEINSHVGRSCRVAESWGDGRGHSLRIVGKIGLKGRNFRSQALFLASDR